MRVLAIINQKGGVGKSSTALELGAGLILKGYRVLYIDLDAQGNLTYSLGADQQGYNAMGVLQRPETIKDEIQHLPQGDIIASSVSLAQADALLTDVGKEYKLKEALERLKDVYDYVIVDTPPALSILTVNALTACTGMIIPAQADIFSLQGIGQLSTTVATVKKYCNPDLKILGIVLTRYNQRTALSRDLTNILDDMAQKLHTKLFNTRIRECIAIKEAQAYKQSVLSYAPKSNATADYTALLEEVLEGCNVQ